MSPEMRSRYHHGHPRAHGAVGGWREEYSETTSKLLNTSVSVSAGSHRFVFYAVNTAGQKWEGIVNATAK
jgi:hypothetical protein